MSLRCGTLMLLALVCVLFVNAGSAYPKREREQMEGFEFSERSKIQLKRAAAKIIGELCLNPETEPEILETFCQRAIRRYLGKTASSSFDIEARSCLHCNFADPLCFNSCPH